MYCASMPEHVRMWSRIVCSTILQLSQQQLFTRFAWQSTRASPDGTATQAANIQRSMRSRDKNCTSLHLPWARPRRSPWAAARARSLRVSNGPFRLRAPQTP